MELIYILVIGGIIDAYGYGCGAGFGNRLGRFVIRQSRVGAGGGILH